jgi:hypothetical protein
MPHRRAAIEAVEDDVDRSLCSRGNRIGNR